ncbi:MAG: phenylalanine--tRNA ligase subunit beta [Planctomycetota bacterium]
MDISLDWLNRYLDPGDVTADEAERVLTHAGYPVEGQTEHPWGDVTLDVEVTSNRGDLLCHVGCAREIAAARSADKPRSLVLPASDEPELARSPAIGQTLSLSNEQPDVCPLFTARLIRGVKVGPSPEWLVRLLEALGQRSINNVVDVTNFITFELGNPCHVFDLAKLAGQKLVVRYATEGEALTTLDGKPRTLKASDLVVADAEGATSLAGVIGGMDSEVDDTTTDVVFEMATWDPVTIRTAARRMAIRTDAGFRFERIVDPRTIDAAARRAVALIAELTGGTVAEGVLSEGAPMPSASSITVRPDRCREVLGVEVSTDEIASMLRGHEVEVDLEAGTDVEAGGSLRCVPPAFRPDLTREIDLIEEVARTMGYSRVPMSDTIAIRVTHPQESERARRELGSVLTGLGFWETVTFSFVQPEHAEPWYAEGLNQARVDDDRRGAEPTLRPSVIPNLLLCRKHNADTQADAHVLGGSSGGAAGGRGGQGTRLYELSATFAQTEANRSVERRLLTMLMDVEGVAAGKQPSRDQLQAAVRAIRGAVEHVVSAMSGPARPVVVSPAEPACAGWHESGHASVSVDGTPIGVFGIVGDGPRRLAGLDRSVVAAELDLDALVELYPPRGRVEPLAAFPAIERDLSLVVDEAVAWDSISSLIGEAALDHFESAAFVGAFRSEAVGAGKKSVTARLSFRRDDGTLRHGDVDPQISRVVGLATEKLGASIRS